MKWNLREKLEQARADDRSGRGLPGEDRSPWLVRSDDAEPADPLDLRALSPTRPSNEGLPVWTGERTGADALHRAVESNPTATQTVTDGDPCRMCGEVVHTDIVDLVNGVTHLSCRGCGFRYHVDCPA